MQSGSSNTPTSPESHVRMRALELENQTWTKAHMDRYSRRWGTENSYKTIKYFLVWTTSKNFPVRWFYFGFEILLYDMWLLVDFVVQVSLDRVEQRTKPRIRAKRFLEFVCSSLLVPS